MRKGKAVLLLLFLCFFLLGASKQEGASGRITDQADILTQREEEKLAIQMEEMETPIDWDILLVSTSDTQGMDAVVYGETWVEEHGAGENGVICLIDMDNRELVISAFGDAIYYLTDARKEEILDEAYEEASRGAYCRAFEAMVEGIRQAYWRGIPDDQYTYDEDTGEIVWYRERKGISRWDVLVAAVAALLAGGAVFAAVVGKYRLKWGGYQYSWRENGSVSLTEKEDSFVNQVVTHRRIPRSSSKGGSGKGSGRSTVHTGAGGRKFSSSRRKF